MNKLFSKQGKLASKRKSLWQRFKDIAMMDVNTLVTGLDESSLDTIEEILIQADFGVQATTRLLDDITTEAKRGEVKTFDDFVSLMQNRMLNILSNNGGAPELNLTAAPGKPNVILMIGVNGVGKTTTIAKLAHKLQRNGKSVLLAAGDTFRAGAIEQIREWGKRLNCRVIAQKSGADPAAVIYDSLEAAEKDGTEVVICDTAGRLHTQSNLMEELSKISRVIKKKYPEAPHETLLVLDATTGQNALMQAKTFKQSLDLSGLVLAKLDGTAKGGIVVAIFEELKIPIKFIGIGEALEDFETFNPGKFVENLVG